MSGNMLGHDAECDCGPCDNERMQKYLTRNSPCNFCLPTRKKQAARIGELEAENKAQKALIENFKLDDLMDIFKSKLEESIVETFKAGRGDAAAQCYQIASSHEFGPDAAKTIRETFGLEI